ncbi:MAG: phospholipase D-like domain-containing protein [Halodesulfurarchaeum sp.]
MIGRLLVIALLASSGNATIDWIYPNPTTDGDVGEFVVLDVPENGSLEGLSLTDGEDTVSLPATSADGRIAVTDDPRVASTLTDYPVLVTDRFLALSNSGDTVTLRDGNRTVETLSYDRAPEAERYDGQEWVPIGRTSFEPEAVRDVPTTVFSLPDATEPIYRAIEQADERILLGGYTLSDPGIARRLRDANDRGVDVVVLLEGGPVGGMSTAQATQVDELTASGITVRLVGGERVRYDFHHAKYAVVDDAVLVTSENWKPGGVGGHGSRGWGVILEDPRLADHLARVFEADSTWKDSKDWSEARPADFQDEIPDNATYPSRYAPHTTHVDDATIILAPDNAEDTVLDVLGRANRSIKIQQITVERNGPLVEETIQAARRGADVEILLSSAWYVESDNRKIAADLRRQADAEDLPMSVRLVEPRSRFDHVHNKGVIVDGRYVLVGSLNWNDHSFEENREVAVLIEDPTVGSYYERVFLADWRGATWRVQWSFVAVTCAVVAAALRYGYGMATFENRTREERPPIEHE